MRDRSDRGTLRLPELVLVIVGSTFDVESEDYQLLYPL